MAYYYIIWHWVDEKKLAWSSKKKCKSHVIKWKTKHIHSSLHAGRDTVRVFKRAFSIKFSIFIVFAWLNDFFCDNLRTAMTWKWCHPFNSQINDKSALIRNLSSQIKSLKVIKNHDNFYMSLILGKTILGNKQGMLRKEGGLEDCLNLKYTQPLSSLQLDSCTNTIY